MRKIMRLSLAGLILLGLSGCLQTTDEFYLNPDGSGKVIHEAILKLTDLGFGPQLTAEQKMKGMAQDELDKAQGVDIWTGVQERLTEEGKVYFKGTAYFKDINALRFYNAGGQINILKGSLRKDEIGQLVMELVNEQPKEEAGAAVEPPAELSAEELKAKVAQEKVKFEQMRPMFDWIFSTMKIQKTYHFPGQVVEANNFKELGPGVYFINFDGGRMLDVINQLFFDEEWISEQVKQGRDVFKQAPEKDYRINKMLFGEQGPVRLAAAGALNPLFDYEKEVAAARAEIQKTTKVSAIPGEGPGAKEEAEVSNVQVGGVRIVYLSDDDRGLRPFNGDAGYAVSLILTLPKEAVKVGEGKLLNATADNGTNLLPQNEWAQRTQFAQLGTDKKDVEFEVYLSLPDDPVKGIKELSGVLEYFTSGATRKVDLGIGEFVAGTKGQGYNSGISSVGEDDQQKGSQKLKLKIGYPSSQIKNMGIYDDKNKPVEIAGTEWTSEDLVTEYDFISPNKFPSRGRIVMERYEGLKKKEMSFRLLNVSLLGRPLEILPATVKTPATAAGENVPGGNETKAAQEDTYQVLLNEDVVIEIAKKHAKEEGIKLDDYKKIKARYSFMERIWRVTFQMDPMPPGGWLDVLIDDTTSKVLELRKGL